MVSLLLVNEQLISQHLFSSVLHRLPFLLRTPPSHSTRPQNYSNSDQPSRCFHFRTALARATYSYADMASSHPHLIVRDGVTLRLYARAMSQLARRAGMLPYSSRAHHRSPSSSLGRTSDGASLHPLDRDRSSQLALHCPVGMQTSTHYCRLGLYR